MLSYHSILIWLLVVSFKYKFVNAFEEDESSNPEDESDFVFSGCGKSGFSNGLESRIRGGKNATQSDWPWHVQLEQVMDRPASENSSKVRQSMKFPVCGASLINKDWVLTAAHCVYSYAKKKTMFRFQITFGDGDNPNATVVRSAKKLFVHPFYEYVISQMKSDLALILLDKSVRFTRDISPICLIDTDLDLTGHTAYLTGRGLTSVAGKHSMRFGKYMFPESLQSAKMEILHNSECLEMLSKDEGCPHCKRILKTSDSVICAGLLDGTVSAANGDSGGPLVVQRFDGTWTQVGVVSSGHPEYKFGIFTKVAKHLEWIDEVLQTHSPREEVEEVDELDELDELDEEEDNEIS